MDAWNAGLGYRPGLRFYNTNGLEMGSLESWADHGAAPDTPELIITSMRNIALQTGRDFMGDGGLQMGASGENGIQYNQYASVRMYDTTSTDGLTSWPFNHSSRFGWAVQAALDTNHYGAGLPGIIGFPASTNWYFPLAPYQILGELWFYSSLPQLQYRVFQDYPGVLVGKMLTNGWNFRGKLIQQRMVDNIFSASFTLDFNRSALVDIQCETTNITFYTTNATGSASDYESRIFILRAGGLSPTLHWPAGWSWLGQNSPGVPPGSLASGQLLRLRLESVGVGESNILASAELALDSTFAWDQDAQDFLTRASITDPVARSAINELVNQLKAGGVWPLHYAIYPFVGDNSEAHRQNLVSGAYPINWQGTTHSIHGVTFDGIAAYGDTTYNIFAAGSTNSIVTNSFHTFVYCESGTNWLSTFPNASPIGASDSNFRLGIIKINYAQLASQGFNDADYFGAIIQLPADDERGPMLATRTTFHEGAFYCRSSASSDFSQSAGVPNSNVFIGATSYGSDATKPLRNHARWCLVWCRHDRRAMGDLPRRVG